MTEMKFSTMELATWSKIMNSGAANAVFGLSKLLERQVRLTCLNLKTMPPQHAADLLGGPENLVVAVYTMVQGDAQGHVLLAYPPDTAFGLIDMVLGNAPHTTDELGEMEESVLAELGNIAGAAFLNTIGNNTGISLRPSPPVVIVDMAGAILSIALTDILQKHDEIYAMEAVFDTSERHVSGVLLIMPSGELLEAVKSLTTADESKS